ncbi:MAG: GDSL-type esterase/lipase family protein [Oscillospiraceae bacterium]
MKRILCYGDSNTWGNIPADGRRYPADVRWTGVAAKLLGDGYSIIEEGLNGRTTSFDDYYVDCRNGRKGLGYALCAHAPIDLIVVSLGTNDLKYTGAVGSYKGLDELLRLIEHADGCYPAAGCSIFQTASKSLSSPPSISIRILLSCVRNRAFTTSTKNL